MVVVFVDGTLCFLKFAGGRTIYIHILMLCLDTSLRCLEQQLCRLVPLLLSTLLHITIVLWNYSTIFYL